MLNFPKKEKEFKHGYSDPFFPSYKFKICACLILEFQSGVGLSDDDNDRFYHLEDLSMGAVLWVGGRDILVYDCDEATRSFYKEVVGKGRWVYGDAARQK